MRLSHAACTDVGRKRRVNEDAYAVVAERGLFVVADGLGGHVAGRRAAETATDTFVACLARCADDPPAQAMRDAMQCANTAVLAAAELSEGLRGMATTLVSLWIDGREATFAHLGDSRLYLMRDKKLHPLTLDHSLVAELVARGELDERALHEHPQRHVITRAIGVGREVDPEVASLGVRDGDVFVLCSDGISGQVDPAELREIVDSGRGDLAAAARELVACANAHGGDDNATVVLVAACNATHVAG